VVWEVRRGSDDDDIAIAIAIAAVRPRALSRGHDISGIARWAPRGSAPEIPRQRRGGAGSCGSEGPGKGGSPRCGRRQGRRLPLPLPNPLTLAATLVTGEIVGALDAPRHIRLAAAGARR
jgi:hypothetical protein